MKRDMYFSCFERADLNYILKRFAKDELIFRVPKDRVKPLQKWLKEFHFKADVLPNNLATGTTPEQFVPLAKKRRAEREAKAQEEKLERMERIERKRFY